MWIGTACRGAIFKKTFNTFAQIPCRELANFTKKSVDLNFMRFKKCETTPQSPVLILHGLLSSKTSWENVSEAINLTTGREVISVDARNHGESPHRPSHNYFDMMYDTVKLIKKLNLHNVTLIGHSMGAKTAMILALFYPELVSSLISVDISPVSTSQQIANNFPRVLDVANNINFEGYKLRTVDDAVNFAKASMHSSGITRQYVVDFIVKNVGIKTDGTVGWRPNVEVLREYFPTMLTFPYVPGKIYAGPTLFIKAELSDFISADDLSGIKNYYPKAQLKLIPGASHNIHDVEPTTLLKFAVEFLIEHR